MTFTYILIDFENVKPTAADLKLIRGAGYRVRIFHGPHQNKFDADIVKALQPLGRQVEFVQCERSGKNALDFHIAFYLGRMLPDPELAVVTSQTSVRFFVVSKDAGFDVLLGHVRELGYGAARVASVLDALTGDGAPVADIRERAATKEATAAATKKSATPALKNAAKADPWSRILENLRDHPKNRPTTLKTLERHLATLLGKDASLDEVRNWAARLQHEGIAKTNGGKVEYNVPRK